MSTEWEAAWQAAIALARSVESGAAPPSVSATLALQHGEVQYGSANFDVWAYFGVDVHIGEPYGFLESLGGGLSHALWNATVGKARDARERGERERHGRPQWRHDGPVPTTITSERTIVFAEDQFKSYRHGEVIKIVPMPQEWYVVIIWEGQTPKLFHGPWAPWLTVAMCARRFGSPWLPGVDYRRALSA